MIVRGIEAIKLNIPPTNDKINPNVREEKGFEILIKASTDASAANMTSVERYRQEWENLANESLENISEKAFNGELRISKFRSVYWALLLRVLNGEEKSWAMQRSQQRNRYKSLQQEFIKNPHELSVPDDDDPLSQSTKSVWNQYFSDQELFSVIRQDVVRTFPGVDFFRKPIIQNSMINILFYYAREHPYMCYRQGMHEILAPIIFVMYGDQQSFMHFKELTTTDIDRTLLDVLNPDYLEADSYSMFSRLMSSVESYYRVSNLVQSPTGYIQISAKKNTEEAANEVEVIAQLNSIRGKILAKEDLHLHNYLLKLEIPLHIFGIRWLRLLFGREFPLLDLLIVWDAIFADSDRFDLPNYILVAMLIHIRHKLLLSDYTTALTYLMRYPANVDVHLILKHALHMQMPKKFERPANAFIYFTPQNKLNTTNESGKNMQTMSGPSKSSQYQHGMRASSLSDEQTLKQIKMLQIQNAAECSELARIKGAAESKHVAMDGYLDNSPELMCLELKNAQTVITIARQKLQNYLGVIRQHTLRTSSEQLAQAVDGIDELCTFLDVKFMFPLHAPIGRIDHALEADELQRRAHTFTEHVHDIENSKGYTLENAEEHSVFNSLMPNTLGAAAAAGSKSVTTTSYEKPDNAYMLSTSRFLGNKFEIELMTIAKDEKGVLNEKSSNCPLPKADPLKPRED